MDQEDETDPAIQKNPSIPDGPAILNSSRMEKRKGIGFKKSSTGSGGPEHPKYSWLGGSEEEFRQHVFPTISLKREDPNTSDAKFAEDGNLGSALQETVSKRSLKTRMYHLCGKSVESRGKPSD